jgi:hypothetical protein
MHCSLKSTAEKANQSPVRYYTADWHKLCFVTYAPSVQNMGLWFWFILLCVNVFHSTQNFFSNRFIKEALKYSFKVSDALQTDFTGIRIIRIASHFVVLI